MLSSISITLSICTQGKSTFCYTHWFSCQLQLYSPVTQNYITKLHSEAFGQLTIFLFVCHIISFHRVNPQVIKCCICFFKRYIKGPSHVLVGIYSHCRNGTVLTCTHCKQKILSSYHCMRSAHMINLTYHILSFLCFARGHGSQIISVKIIKFLIIKVYPAATSVLA